MLRKNYYLPFFLVVLICFPVSALPREKYISVKEIAAKAKPSIWGETNVTFFYGDKVQILEQKKSWIKVSGFGKTGWIKDSCVTSRKIKAGTNISVDADELSLAGKGFNNSLETEYSNSYNIDFNIVDAVENVSFDNRALRDFINDGNLKGAE